MIAYLDNELKVLKSIDRDVKSNWLEELNKYLTMTQGKGQPHEIFTNKTFLSKLKHFLRTRPHKHPELNKYVNNDAWMNEYYAGALQVWTWGLNKVVYKLPEHLFDLVNEDLDFEKVPSHPLFQLPQWATMVDLGIEKIETNPDVDTRVRLLLASVTVIDNKEYLNVRAYITPTDPVAKSIISYTTSIGFYIAKDAKTLKEGIIKAENEITECDDTKHNRFTIMKLDTHKSAINNLLNIIMFINGEYSKSELKRSDVKWIPKGMSTGSGYKIRQRPLPVFQVIGEQYSTLCTGSGTRTVSRASHFRKGHFCTYWLGPRNTEQTPIIHWIPPMQVKGSIKGEEND